MTEYTSAKEEILASYDINQLQKIAEKGWPAADKHQGLRGNLSRIFG